MENYYRITNIKVDDLPKHGMLITDKYTKLAAVMSSLYLNRKMFLKLDYRTFRIVHHDHFEVTSVPIPKEWYTNTTNILKLNLQSGFGMGMPYDIPIITDIIVIDNTDIDIHETLEQCGINCYKYNKTIGFYSHEDCTLFRTSNYELISNHYSLV